MEDIKVKVNALVEEEKASLDRIEAEYKEQLAGLRREAEVKGQKMGKQATWHGHLIHLPSNLHIKFSDSKM
ncbi:UNVERIFIED_CONTAM: Transcription factor AS1 [Sesamum calycinum]|uniref:Transcription factor AS1 n=1 Tax=Sesamum calycinum TaxID=2727403 RepID=A0AAW2LBD6_9LAMI